MAEGKIKINLSIAGRNYPMNIEPEKEELCREAAKRLNNSIAEFARVPNFDATDRLAMAALRYSMMLLNTQQSSSLGDGDIEELHAIEERIRNYIK